MGRQPNSYMALPGIKTQAAVVLTATPAQPPKIEAVPRSWENFDRNLGKPVDMGMGSQPNSFMTLPGIKPRLLW